MLSPVRLSVRLSVTRVDQSKTVEVRIMQLSPQCSPMTQVTLWLTLSRNSKDNMGDGTPNDRVYISTFQRCIDDLDTAKRSEVRGDLVRCVLYTKLAYLCSVVFARGDSGAIFTVGCFLCVSVWSCGF